MRAVSFIFLMVFLAAVGIFAYQNQDLIQVTFLNQHIETNVAALAGVVFLVGMFAGWSIVGMLRRSWQRVTADGHSYQYR